MDCQLDWGNNVKQKCNVLFLCTIKYLVYRLFMFLENAHALGNPVGDDLPGVAPPNHPPIHGKALRPQQLGDVSSSIRKAVTIECVNTENRRVCVQYLRCLVEETDPDRRVSSAYPKTSVRTQPWMGGARSRHFLPLRVSKEKRCSYT